MRIPLLSGAMSDSHSRPGAIAKIALVAFPLMVVLVLFELGLRLIFPLDLGSSKQHRLPDPTLGWVLEPGVSYTNPVGSLEVPVSYNSRGWRDVEHATLPDPGVSRIVVLGDSFMEGYSVAMEDLFARQLEAELGRAGHPAEVMNLGVGGFGTLQELLAFRREGEPYQPSRVLLAFSENDLANNLQVLETMANSDNSIKTTSRPFLSPDPGWTISVVDYPGALARFQQQRKRERESLKEALTRNSVLFQQSQRGIKRIKRMLKQQRKRDAAERATPSERCNALYDQAWQVTERILARLREEVREADAELWLFTVPFIDQSGVRDARSAASCKPCVCPTSTAPVSQLAQICERLGIRLVDLYPLISDPGGGDPKRFYHAEDAHWNAAGHALAAKAIAEALLLED